MVRDTPRGPGTHTCWEEEVARETSHGKQFASPPLHQYFTCSAITHAWETTSFWASGERTVSFWIHAYLVFDSIKFMFSWAFFSAYIRGLKLKSKTFQMTRYQHKKTHKQTELFRLPQGPVTNENNILGVLSTSLQSWKISNRWEREESISRWQKRGGKR